MNSKLLKSVPDQEWRALIYTIIAPYFYMCRSIPTLEQDDLEQEAWLQLMRACDDYVEDKGKNCKFTSFAYTYIRNGVSAFVRAQTYRSKRQIHGNKLGENFFDTIEDKINDEASSDSNDFVGLLMEMMSPAQAEIFNMRFIKGLTYREIANKFTINNKSVSFQHIEQTLGEAVEDLGRRLHYENYFIH